MAYPDYGLRHRRVRERFAPLVARGLAVCARCGLPIAAREKWDLGHVDGDALHYAGPEHRRCNRATARHAVERRRVSRDW